VQLKEEQWGYRAVARHASLLCGVPGCFCDLSWEETACCFRVVSAEKVQAALESGSGGQGSFWLLGSFGSFSDSRCREAVLGCEMQSE